MKIILFVAAAMGCAAIAVAEEQRPLQPVDRNPIGDEKKCSDLFYSNTFSGASADQIVFASKAPDGKIQRGMVMKPRITVHFSEKPSTYEKKMVGTQEFAIFRLTKADYEKSRDCLPEPTPEPAVP